MALLHEPVHVSIAAEPQRTAAIQQRAIQVDESRRTPLLRHLLQTEPEGWSRVLVFVATRYATEHVSDKLWAHGIKAAALHGELSQGARTQVLAALRSGEIQVLVATDVAARGLDIRRPAGGGQLRPATFAGRLHPPNWPHRPRRCEPAGGEFCAGQRPRPISA